jgi:MORN repeat variant
LEVFHEYDSYFQMASSFNFKYIADIWKILLPFFKKNFNEAQNPSLLEIGRKIRKSLFLFWLLFGLFVSLQVVIVLYQKYSDEEPNDKHFAAYEFVEQGLENKATNENQPQTFDFEDGTQEQFYSNGQLKERAGFKDGYLQGRDIRYNESGTIIEIANYDKGLLNREQKYFYENGELNIVANFNHSLRHGTIIFYYQNGQIFEKSKWINGKPDGDFTVFYSNGAVKIRGKYDHGKVVGKFSYY